MKDYSQLPQVAPEFDLTDLLEAGCHFGHQKAKWNPKMADFIYMEKDGIHIFDLEKTANQLQIAYNFVHEMASKGKTMIMVGTKKQAKPIIEDAAKENEVMYITSRWLGGLLTNWSQVKQSLKRMISISDGLKAGKYDGYTKFEKVQLEKEATRLERFFGGIKDLKNTPDFLFVVDVGREKNAVIEARLTGIPVIALIDSNANPEDIDIAIPANDDALRSIKFIVDQIALAYATGKKSAGKGSASKVAPKTVDKEESASTPEDLEKPVAEVKPTIEAKPATEKKSAVKKTSAKVELKKVAEKKVTTKTETAPKKKAVAKKTTAKTAKSSKGAK